MTKPEVSEEMIAAGADFDAEAMHKCMTATEYYSGIYLAMKAAEPLPQGDECWQAWKPSDVVEARLCNGMIISGELCELNLGGRDAPTTIVALRFPSAALVRSKPIDRDAMWREGMEYAATMIDKMAATIDCHDAIHRKGEPPQPDVAWAEDLAESIRDRAKQGITAIGSQA